MLQPPQNRKKKPRTCPTSRGPYKATVAGLGSTLSLTVSLRVGRRLDREVTLELALPDTLPPGTYRLEVAAPANLVDDGGGDFEDAVLEVLTSLSVADGGEDGVETLEEVFARLNRPDENVVLKARLMPSDGSPAPSVVSTEEEIGLHIDGIQTLQIRVEERE